MTDFFENLLSNGELQKEIAELKAENERLNRCTMEALPHEGNALRETIKYKQTMQEIKEIAENFCNACKEFEPDKSKVGNCQWCNYNRVLQLIDKAEV